MKKSGASHSQPASDSISTHIAELGDWRGDTLRRVRELIRQADPDVVEEWKWVKPTRPGIPVWSHDGIICTGESYKNVVKLTFARGASLEDPARLFNASLEGNVRRAIDIHEGDTIDESAFKALVRRAVAFNRAGRSKQESSRAAIRRFAKGDGEAPVRAYIAAMPGWKRDAGRRLDALIVRTVPGVRKAVRWNSPFYGIEGQGWFLAFHCFTKYVKVTFFRGSSLHPLPPVGSRDPDARYVHIHEGEPFDERLLASWIRQAAKLPGWIP